MQKMIEVQTEQLLQWSTVLRPECMAKLRQFAHDSNKEAETPWDIRRGTDLDQFVANMRNGQI